MAGEATITLSEHDYAIANRHWLDRTLLSRRRLRGGHAGTLVLCAAIGGAMAWWDGTDPPTGAILWMLCGTVAIFAFYGVCRLLVPRQSRRLFRQQVTLHDAVHYHWSDDGLGYRSAHATGQLAWPEFHRWDEGRHGFMFFLNDRMFYLLPRRALTEAQADDLRATAARLGPDPL